MREIALFAFVLFVIVGFSMFARQLASEPSKGPEASIGQYGTFTYEAIDGSIVVQPRMSPE